VPCSGWGLVVCSSDVMIDIRYSIFDTRYFRLDTRAGRPKQGVPSMELERGAGAWVASRI